MTDHDHRREVSLSISTRDELTVVLESFRSLLSETMVASIQENLIERLERAAVVEKNDIMSAMQHALNSELENTGENERAIPWLLIGALALGGAVAYAGFQWAFNEIGKAQQQQ